MGAFCVLLGCVVVTRQVAVRVLAAALAFVPAMLFGVAAVNKYYDYYQTWGSAAADLTVRGRLSHLTRTVYLYLPPQYFQARYSRARFPAIELITGVPGQPQDWIDVVGVTQSYLTLLRDGAVRPAVLVMPDANGGRRI